MMFGFVECGSKQFGEPLRLGDGGAVDVRGVVSVAHKYMKEKCYLSLLPCKRILA